MAIVTLYDIDEDQLREWAVENCPSFVSWLIYENSNAFSFDVLGEEPEWHIRYEFEFYNEQDALLFQLRWQGQ
jgi:hypothetical protein